MQDDDTPLDLDELLANIGGDEQLADALLQRLEQDLPRRIADLRRGLGTGDAEYVHAVSHPLKGALASVRAKQAQARAHTLDDAARQGDLDAARRALPALEEALERLRSEIAAWRAG